MCLIDVFNKYACVKPLEDKKGKKVLNGFIEIVNKFNRKPNKFGSIKSRKRSLQ